MKAIVADINEVPEALRGEYELRDGKHVLKVEGDELPGFVPAAKHAQFRDTNIKLLKALGAETPESALARAAAFAGYTPEKLAELKDVDPAEYRALKAKVEALEKKGVTKPDDVQAAITAALDSALKPLREQLASTVEREKAKDARLAQGLLRDAVSPLYAKVGGRPNAFAFVAGKFAETFRVVDEKVVAADGQYGPNGEPLTPEEWIAKATKEYDFAFEPSKGSGATPGSTGNGHTPHKGGPFRTSAGVEIKTDGIAVL